jgi:hypothetical protein
MSLKINMLKWFLMLVVFAGVIIQFIRPARTVSQGVRDQDISKAYSVPGNVYESLRRSCYDCHSSETVYPWYSHIQPLGWWLQDHIDEGKRELNFSDFACYPLKKQRHKLEEIVEVVEGGQMPLPNYLWIHRNARLDEHQKKIMIKWARDLRKELAGKETAADGSF